MRMPDNFHSDRSQQKLTISNRIPDRPNLNVQYLVLTLTPISAGGSQGGRDIVQFVPFNKYAHVSCTNIKFFLWSF